MTERDRKTMMGWIGLSRALLDYGGSGLAKTMALVAFAAILEGFGLVLLLPIVELIVIDTPATHFSSRIADFLEQMGAVAWWHRMVILFSGFFLVMLLRATILLRRDVAIMSISQGFVNHMRQQLLRALVYSNWSRIQSLRKAHMLDSLTTNIGRIGQAMRFATQSSISVAMVLVFLITAFLVSIPTGFLLLTTILIACFFGAIWFARSKRLGTSITHSNQKISQETVHFLDGLKAAKVTQAEEQFLARFADAVMQARNFAVEFSRQQGRMRRGVELLGALIAMLLVGLGFGVFDVSSVELLLIGGILVRLIPALNAGLSGLQGVANALSAFDVAQQLHAEAIEGAHIPQQANTPSLPWPSAQSLKIEDLVFGYSADKIVLRCKSLVLPANGLVMISGVSGSGKTSMADLIAGLVQPQVGQLQYGDMMLNEAGHVRWQQMISYAVQDSFLIEGSVRENILWPDRSADDADLWCVLDEACVGDVIRALPLGLDEDMRMAGGRLSGGERQRVALARAFLRPANILILDESLSALDRHNGRRLMAHLQNRAKQQLVLMISHEEAYAEHCDHHVRVAYGEAQLVKEHL